ncbi:MAG: alpha/beta hydrolase [Deltaproteobacteria bacterium]|nr:alpha/beta hydrolase [Deltaproteobacteria bacterium]
MKTRIIQQWIVGELSWRRVWRSTWLIIASVYGFFLVYGLFLADSLIFQPQPATYVQSSRFSQLTTENGDVITIRYLPHPHARYTILHSHGNAEDLGDIEGILETFLMQGFSVIAYDYSGYGTSTGKPSEAALYANILAVYEYLRDHQQISPCQILVFGRSVGGGPSVELAAHHPVGGLILESVFTSAFRTITRIPIFPIDKFNNLRKISSVSCPILVIHGQQDEVIPFRHGEEMYARAPSPKMRLWVTSAHHNDVMWTAGEEYWATLAEFTKLVDAHTCMNEEK